MPSTTEPSSLLDTLALAIAQERAATAAAMLRQHLASQAWHDYLVDCRDVQTRRASRLADEAAAVATTELGQARAATNAALRDAAGLSTRARDLARGGADAPPEPDATYVDHLAPDLPSGEYSDLARPQAVTL